MENSQSILSDFNNKQSINQPQNQDLATVQKCHNSTNLIEPEVEAAEPEVEEMEGKTVGVELKEESRGNCEVSGSGGGGGGVILSDEMVDFGGGSMEDRVAEVVMDSGGEDEVGGIAGGENLMVADTNVVDKNVKNEIVEMDVRGVVLNEEVISVGKSDEMVDFEVAVDSGGEGIIGGIARGENVMVADSAKVEVEESIQKDEVVEMNTMETDEMGNEESVARESHSGERIMVDCDDMMNERMDGGVSVGKVKVEMDICAESSMRIGEGSISHSECVLTSCDRVGDNEVILAENDEVKEAVMEENLMDVSEKEKGKGLELVEADVCGYEKDEVKGEVEENDELKEAMEGNSSFGGNKLDAGEEVGMNVEECRDSKEVDSESTVSESLADKSGKGDEVEGEEEGEAGDIRMETEANTEADALDIKKEEEPENTGDSEAPQTHQDEEMVPEEETNADTEVETASDVAEPGKTAVGKRKRLKNRSPGDTNITPKAGKTIEEDVCFICFDGGALVLCDRRGCPKAYHPYCVNREEAYFVGKSRWNCGWHLCSICEKKNAHYLCYTCPFSLCKGCIKDAVVFCVRGKKGFCETCMKFVKLLESNEQGVKDVQVDFNDNGSWEYLFRDYFTELKSKLSISSAEIAEAKSPWKGLDTPAGKVDKQSSGMQENHDVKQESPEPPNDHKYDAELDAKNLNENEEATKPRRKKVKRRLKTRGKRHTSSRAAEAISDEDGPVNTEWASKELLEFVMHMKSGDRSILSEYDVQALLLEYIKRNNLRDPRQKSKIICDPRLQSLFGKPRVGHFEMLKLLESHFFAREDSHTGDVQGSIVDTNSEQLEVDGDADTPKGTKEKKRKSRKKGDRRGPQSNLDDYAAIDMHNINVIYLRRKLMEDLLEDSETFKDKVDGTFVRIRISGSVQNQDIYRLVQVVGTSNAAEPYKVGKRTTNIMVEILNLNKTEIISIDTVSNQDFTEDECKRLRQSIKCGLINRVTVGDILDKATDLQTAKVNDWLETEVVRLSHLRDRASEKGHKKELRECVEKLQLLKTPEERQRRLDEIPEIHADPKMDPTYESEEDDIDVDENRQDVNTRVRGPGSRGGRGQISPGSETLSKDPFSRASKYLNQSRDNTPHFGEVQGKTPWNQVTDRTSPESSNLDKFGSTAGSDTPVWNSHDVRKSESLSSSVSKPAPALTKTVESIKINESEKNWYYKDPSGKVQGPFSVAQLRKWNNTGYFPAGLKVWRTNEKQEDAILLTDALSGKFLKESSAAASVLASSLSANLTNIMASLEHAREHQDRERLRSDLNASGNLPSHIVSPRGQASPSVEHPKFSTERWSRSESSSLPSSLPSPTPILNNATSYFGRSSALPTPTTVAPEYQGVSATPTSGLRSGETLNEPVSTGLSGVQVGLLAGSNTSQNLHSVINSEARAIQVHGNMAVAQTSFAPQTISNQLPITGTPGWASAQSQIIDTNAALPVQPQTQAYGQWGNIPAAAYTPPGNPQGNQPFPALPNTSWAVLTPDNNTPTAPAPRPENPNPNFGWGVMQGNQNTAWVGAPPTNANVNWGAVPFQPPPPPNQNMGWTMPPGNLGAAVQGQLPAVSGWTTGTKNPPVQGLPPAGNVHQSYVAQTGNVSSNVHMTPSGSGWSPAPGILGAPVPGLVPGNANQGPWGADQNHSGGQFSNQRNQGSHGGDSGYGGDRSRTGPSFSNGGAGGPSRHSARYQMPCPYNRDGRCRKGAACDYLHT